MPAISQFEGISIYMYDEIGGQHNFPHIHVYYSDESAVYTLDGRLFEGKLKRSKEKLVLKWLKLHQNEVETNWKLLSAGEAPVKISPLK